jgi:hypothetical protein
MVATQMVTEAPQVNSIVTVSSRTPQTPQLLTKRRAVDFCRVATAICCGALRVAA